MRLQFFHISGLDNAAATEELNRFLASNRIVSIDKEFCENGAASYWSVCVTWLEGSVPLTASKKTRIDYRQVLDEKDFALFAKLRDLRKELSEAEGLPPYALFTNDQLASMVEQGIDTLAALGQLKGVGNARVEKYGEKFLCLLRQNQGTKKPNAEKQHAQKE